MTNNDNGLARTNHAPPRGDRLALQPRDFRELVQFAETIAGTSFAPTSKAAEIVAMIANGRELGLTAMQSLKAFHNIQGKPSMAADAMVAVIRASGLCEKWDVMESTPARAVIVTRRAGSNRDVEKVWTAEDAKRAQLSTPMWAKYPAQMLRHRCAADLARQEYPDVLLGVYTPDEISDGEYVGDAPIVEAAPQLPPHVAAALADEPQGSRAWAEYVAEIADAESCVAAHCLYVALVAAEGETYTREAGDMAEARLKAIGYQLDRAEVNAVLAATGQPLARWVDAADEALGNNTGADAVHVAARWWVAQRERISAALSKPAATMVYMALARSLRTTPDAAGTARAKKALNAAVEALAPKPPPTGTDSPSSTRNDTATDDATPADATPSAEAQASIARVGDPLAYLATKHTYTEVERAVVAHGAHVPALAAAAVARLEALGEGGDDGNRERLVAAWVSESASRAQRAERTAAKVQRAA